MKTEEKAKAYDRAKEKIVLRFGSNVAEEIFSEFDESEDEKIISAIRKAIEAKVENLGNGVTRTACLAWLEKQGKPVEINPTEFDLQLNRLLVQFETLTKEELASSLSFYLNVVKNGYLSDNAEPTDYNSIDPHFGKPIDKVEPKFKVGDWCIDNEDGLIFQIVKVLDKTYRYRTNEGKEYSCTHYSLELDARFWTIKDANEGDVLVDSLGNVCIYQEPSTKLMYHSHCYGNHKFFIPMVGSHEIVGSYPATKEQRDQLKKAMADAGYTFDFEKKKLKKLKFKVGDEVITENESSLTITKIDEEGYWSNDLFICDFDNECNWNLVEQKPSVKGEPKFKVGDYVVDNCGYVWRIEGIINQFYILEGIDGGESRPTIEWVNKTFHLWDITEDAKNGDVLASKDEKDILIFRRIEPSTSFSSYYNIKGRGNYGWCDSYFIPATKEQRDKLEKSMADAGYAFDFDKKKLKKIEQKPADKAEPKFKVGDWVIDKQGIVHQVANVVENVTNHTYGYDIVGGGYFNDNAEGVRLWNISDAKDGDVLVNGSNTFIFHFINDTRLMGYCHVNTNDGRFYDDIGKNECFCLIDAVVNPATKEQCDVLFAKMKESGYEWNDDKKELKKIEQKPTWSEDEEDAIIKGELPVVAVSGAFHSFKDRINWKPSEEQIYWLKWAIGRMTNTEKGNEAEAVLKDLLEQLEKLLSTTPKLKT